MKKIIKTSLSSFSTETSLRNDFNYINISNDIQLDRYYKFIDLFEINEKYIDDFFNEDFYYAEIGDVTNQNIVIPHLLNMNNESEDLENKDLYKKIKSGNIMKCQKGDILVPVTRPNLKKYIYIDYEKIDYYYTTAFISLKPKKLNKILYYALKSIFYKNLMAISRMGKGYPTLKNDDLFFMKFSKEDIDKLSNKEEELNDLIHEKEKNINLYIKRKKEINEIINDVFSKEFNYDKELINKVRKGMTYGTQISTNSRLNAFKCNIKNLDGNNIRMSVRANSDIFKKVEKILKNNEVIKLKDIISENVHNGSKPYYVENEEIPVVKTAYLTNNGIDTKNILEYTTKENFEKHVDAQLKKNDILICNIGKCSCGKIDIKEDELESFGANEVTIIRVNSSLYNAKFLLYVLRSIFGIYQIEKAYTGTTNQIHLNPKDVEKFIIPNISIKQQEKIVEEIDEKIKEQNEIEKEIVKELEIIEKALLNAIK